ncbi:MAG: 50S ribosomal protein L11 methyltransferase [Pseudomonadaceae bacterium]|nr:50S ribosomal protein L11 methyltransferase [Pseudomonadaceae bacterium]
MSWLQLELRVAPQSLAASESVLLEAGAVAITLLSDDDEPVLEPAPGETPLWSSVRVLALLPVDTNMALIQAQLQQLPQIPAVLDVQFLADQNWQAQVNNHAVDQVFAERLWLLPKHQKVDEAAAQHYTLLRLEPGLAFGSGSHPTTRLCLQWLAENIQPGQKVLDFGCGSGVLAIAAALLGAEVVGVDHDPQAVLATRENADYNGLDSRQVDVVLAEQWDVHLYPQQFDVVVANILAGPLQDLAEQFESVVSPGGAIVLSGILEAQAQDVADSYARTRYAEPQIEAGWVCLAGVLA